MFSFKLTISSVSLLVHLYFNDLVEAKAALSSGCNTAYNSYGYRYNGNYNYYSSGCQGGYFPSCGKNVRVTKLTDAVETLGDAPFYDDDVKSVYFVDSIVPAIYRYAVYEKKVYSVRIGTSKLNDDNVSVVIPIKGQPGKFLITYNKEFCILTWDGVSKNASFEVIYKPDPFNRPFPQSIINDVKVAPNDALFYFIVPTFTPPDIRSSPRQTSILYSLINGIQKALIPKTDYGNGLGWSCDGNLFYHSDSIDNTTMQSFYNQYTNTLEYTRLILNYTRLNIPGHPDSLTVDAQGYVWTTCQQGGMRVLKIDPYSGGVVCAVELPARSVTNVCFGRCPNGKFECLYVTTSRSIFDRTSAPFTANDGALFSIEGTGSTGVAPKKVDLVRTFGKLYCGCGN